MQLGAKVVKKRDSGDQGLESDAPNKFVEEAVETGGLSLDGMWRRIDLYYTGTQSNQE